MTRGLLLAGFLMASTAVQAQAWEKISRGEHALVVAPTGSGKTLAAFLWALNNLVEREGQLALPVGSGTTGSAAGVKVLYISPLKALGVDVVFECTGLFTERTRAVMPVHLYGHPFLVDQMEAIAKEHGLAIYEDAAQAHGARWKGRPVGNFGAWGMFSLYPTKNMT